MNVKSSRVCLTALCTALPSMPSSGGVSPREDKAVKSGAQSRAEGSRARPLESDCVGSHPDADIGKSMNLAIFLAPWVPHRCILNPLSIFFFSPLLYHRCRIRWGLAGGGGGGYRPLRSVREGTKEPGAPRLTHGFREFMPTGRFSAPLVVMVTVHSHLSSGLSGFWRDAQPRPAQRPVQEKSFRGEGSRQPAPDGTDKNTLGKGKSRRKREKRMFFHPLG